MRTCRHCGREGDGYMDEPTDYLGWHAWADRMSRTHTQHECPGCGRFTVWRLKPKVHVKALALNAARPPIGQPCKGPGVVAT